MVAGILLVAFVIILFLGFVFNRWVSGLKTPAKTIKNHPKRHKR
jgi:hypothetical protein